MTIAASLVREYSAMNEAQRAIVAPPERKICKECDLKRFCF